MLVTSAPLLLVGTAFATGEITEVLDRDLTLPWTIELLAMAGVIVLIVLRHPATPAGAPPAPPAGEHSGRPRPTQAEHAEPAAAGGGRGPHAG